MDAIYNGTVYNIGSAIPNYAENIYTPHVWYDQSKRYGNSANIFEELHISESLVLGESEKDLWTMDEILLQILQYLNLHIVQQGYDYYIFDWETSRTSDTVQWLDIFTGDTFTGTYNTIIINKDMYASNDTQISIADVYNQVQVKDTITELEDVIFSPFDSNILQDATYPQLYMIEYASPGRERDSFINFRNMLNGSQPDAEYGDGGNNSSYKKQWMMKLRKCPYWGFYNDNIDNYSYIPVDGQGDYYDQWKLLSYIHDKPFTSAIVSFGEGKTSNQQNSQNIENITKYEDYICISVNGNGVDEHSASFNPYNPYYIPPTQFPDEGDLDNSYMEIKYLHTTDGVYSSASPDINNYLLFNGDIMLTIPTQYTGYYGWATDDPHGPDWYTKQANDHKPNSQYVDWIIFNRNKNSFANTKSYMNYANIGSLVITSPIYQHCVPSADNDNGMYYEQLFYDTAYPPRTTADVNTENESLVNLSPPIEYGDASKRFHYVLGSKTYYGEDDIIPYVDILACQLSIGNKYCEEYVEGGLKHFRWVTTDELMNRGEGEGYDLLPDGTIRYKVYVNLAINIDADDWVIGQKHQIYNNVFTSMGLDKTGMAIPLPYDEHLSGELRFSIIGPVNLTWDNGTRRHPTWFRHTQLKPNEVSILPHVGNIWISKFEVELVTDRGKNIEFDDSDIVYRSDEQRKYVNIKDDIEFKFTTALTAQEASEMHVNYTTNKSDVANSNGDSILSIINDTTNETDKPEKHYVDAYYREYCQPRMIVETTLHDDNNIKRFNKYTIQYLNKTFHLIKEEKNVIDATTKLTLKEI